MYEPSDRWHIFEQVVIHQSEETQGQATLQFADYIYISHMVLMAD